MDPTPTPVNTDLTPEQLAALRERDRLSNSEKEVYKGRIEELTKERDELKIKLGEAEKPKPEPVKKKSKLNDWLPL